MGVKKKKATYEFFHNISSYYPLIWMFHGRYMENRINRIRETDLNSHMMTAEIYLLKIYLLKITASV